MLSQGMARDLGSFFIARRYVMGLVATHYGGGFWLPWRFGMVWDWYFAGLYCLGYSR